MKLKRYLNEAKGSYLDNKKMPREGQQVYILAGQMADKVVKGTIRKITNIDQKGLANTYFEIEANGKNHHVNIAQVYDHKPKRVKTKDEYGEVTIWEAKADMFQKNMPNRYFVLGREVNNWFAQNHILGLRPTDNDFKKAAKALGITKKDAVKSWNEFTWGK